MQKVHIFEREGKTIALVQVGWAPGFLSFLGSGCRPAAAAQLLPPSVVWRD